MISSALILCNATCPATIKPSHVACINRFDLVKTRDQLGYGIDLLGIPIDLDTAAILRSIDGSLSAEAAVRPQEMRWAPLSLQRMFTRYVHYLQYKERIASWLERAKPDILYLSSGWDKYLVLACRTCCEKAEIPFILLDGAFTPYSGADPFSFAETLPSEWALDPLFFVKMLGNFTRRLGSVIYEFYPNLDDAGFEAVSFKWWRSVAAKGYLIDKVKAAFRRNLPGRGFADYSVHLDSNEIPTLRAPHWDSFEPDEVLVLRSALASFQDKFSNGRLDKLHDSLVAFFKRARPKRLVALDPLIPSSRMLMFSARKAGVPCDFLPHGLTIEDRIGSPHSDFSPARVLAWNEASARRYRTHSYRSTPISHPRNDNNGRQPRARITMPISEQSILILSSTSSASQIDAQDRDLLDIFSALQAIRARDVALKLHAAAQHLAELQWSGLSRLSKTCEFPVSLLDSSLDSRALMTNYDFVIIGGATTAIIEAALAQVPFVIFRGGTDRVGCLDGISFAAAESSAELSRVLKEFDYAAHHEACLAFAKSLVGNPHPLDASLN